MKKDAHPVNSMNELPIATREFLARLSPEDLDTLEEGVKLFSAARRLGRVMKWAIVLAAGTIIGAVMLWENVLKIIGWIKAP